MNSKDSEIGDLDSSKTHVSRSHNLPRWTAAWFFLLSCGLSARSCSFHSASFSLPDCSGEEFTSFVRLYESELLNLYRAEFAKYEDSGGWERFDHFDPILLLSA